MQATWVRAAALLAVLFCGSPIAPGAQYWVATSGNNANPGTQALPFATVKKGVDQAVPGDTVWIGGGNYPEPLQIVPNDAATSTMPIRVWAVAGEQPVLDFTGTSSHGIRISGSYWHFKGLTVEHAGQIGVRLIGESANHNIIEQIEARHCGGGGIDVQTGAHDNQIINCRAWANGNTGINLSDVSNPTSSTTQNNLFLNCDSYENYDPGDHGQDADGFGAKFGVGTGNRFEGCRAWHNSDDGYDTWHAGSAVEFVNCYAWRNGENLWSDPAFEGNGNGFKLGQLEGAHVVSRCAAWDQPQRGFDLNGNSTGVRVEQCTALRCTQNFYFVFILGNAEQNVLRNNLSYDGPVQIDSRIDDANNSWNISGLTIGAADFQSLDPASLQGPRGPNGELPTGPFLQLMATSAAIDAGDDLGAPFSGTAPDLGAFEFAPSLPVPVSSFAFE